jgi:hypothetical protein
MHYGHVVLMIVLVLLALYIGEKYQPLARIGL